MQVLLDEPKPVHAYELYTTLNEKNIRDSYPSVKRIFIEARNIGYQSAAENQ
jgi:hypothetical protein